MNWTAVLSTTSVPHSKLPACRSLVCYNRSQLLSSPDCGLVPIPHTLPCLLVIVRSLLFGGVPCTCECFLPRSRSSFCSLWRTLRRVAVVGSLVAPSPTWRCCLTDAASHRCGADASSPLLRLLHWVFLGECPYEGNTGLGHRDVTSTPSYVFAFGSRFLASEIGTNIYSLLRMGVWR